MPRSTTACAFLIVLLACLTLGLLGCGTGDNNTGNQGQGGNNGGNTNPTQHPTNATQGACLNAEEPPLNPPVSQTYNYSCHDARQAGADPAFLALFVAFHTRLAATDLVMDPRAIAMHPNSGSFADVVVNLPGLGRLEFGRRTSFSPVWVTTAGTRFPVPLLVPRTGDGTAERPDHINRYSWARILRNTANEIVVHWRYVPDPCNPTQTGTVHELFTIRPNATITRLVHCSANTLEQAAATTHNTRQELTLAAAGVTVGSTTPITRGLPAGGASPRPITAHPVGNPALGFRLDEGGTSRTTRDSVSSNAAAVNGRFPNWVPGISGSALAFDGYTTEVGYPAANAPAPTGSFTLEAWVQMAARPFGTVQIAGQASPNGNHAYSPDTVEGGIGTYNMVDPITGLPITNNPVTVGGLGYLLAIDALGQPNVMGNFGGTWSAATGQPLAPHQWHHIVGVYDAGDNELRIYANGAEVGDVPTTCDLNAAVARDFVIGRNREPAWPVAGSEMHDVAFARSIFGHEGLIDEVRPYNRPLTSAEIMMAANRAGAGGAPTLPRRALPTFGGTTFSCSQQTVDYHALWNQLFHDSGFDDVMVTYDLLPTRVLFWKGMTGAPAWICNDTIWTHDQSMEWGDDHGLCEHMSDKNQYYAHVRVLEDTPARKVIHWRYAMVGVTYRLFAGAGEQSFIAEGGSLSRALALDSCTVGSRRSENLEEERRAKRNCLAGSASRRIMTVVPAGCADSPYFASLIVSSTSARPSGTTTVSSLRVERGWPATVYVPGIRPSSTKEPSSLTRALTMCLARRANKSCTRADVGVARASDVFRAAVRICPERGL